MKNSALRTLHFRPRTIRSISTNAMRNPPRMTLLNLLYRNKIFLSVLFLFTAITAKHTNSSYGVDFHYEFETVFSPNADQYLIGQVNMMKVSEGGQITYWCPTVSTGQGELIYKFDFPVVSNDINLKFRLSDFNFGSSYGDASVFGSVDGVSYNLISHLSTPGPPWPYPSDDVFFNYPLGSEFLGQDKLFLKVQLNVVNSNVMAQFLRSDGHPQNYYRPWFSETPIFSITVNGAIVVPEPSGLNLLLIAIFLYFTTSAKSSLIRRLNRF